PGSSPSFPSHPQRVFHLVKEALALFIHFIPAYFCKLPQQFLLFITELLWHFYLDLDILVSSAAPPQVRYSFVSQSEYAPCLSTFRFTLSYFAIQRPHFKF